MEILLKRANQCKREEEGHLQRDFRRYAVNNFCGITYKLLKKEGYYSQNVLFRSTEKICRSLEKKGLIWH